MEGVKPNLNNKQKSQNVNIIKLSKKNEKTRNWAFRFFLNKNLINFNTHNPKSIINRKKKPVHNRRNSNREK
jgi:hypothetical protein